MLIVFTITIMMFVNLIFSSLFYINLTRYHQHLKLVMFIAFVIIFHQYHHCDQTSNIKVTTTISLDVLKSTFCEILRKAASLVQESCLSRWIQESFFKSPKILPLSQSVFTVRFRLISVNLVYLIYVVSH